jgi:diguanylate cyclase (GGDEF)-like protein/PAS domain S-box-containing protein
MGDGTKTKGQLLEELGLMRRRIARLEAERTLAEEALKECESRFEGAFESAAIGMALVSLEGRFLKANQTLCDSLGYSEQELLTKTIESITNPEDVENDLEHRRRLLDDQFPYYQLEKRFCHCDGYTVWTSSSVSVVRDASGRPLYLIAYVENITERKLLEEKIRASSITDELTGLHNRRGFFALAEQQVRLALRTRERLALFFIDLDRMKWINDTLGHQEGDAALVAVARILKDTFRDSDIIGRMGGDEFAILAVGAEETSTIAVRLERNVDKFNKSDGRNWSISLSVGLACCKPEEYCSFEGLLAQADSAMYDEKRKKKSRRVA